ncbi:uncharacterized protein TNCV_1326841 [Trichonephila clavipes]|nr:uncharacterized protein TNCV_1326841 [Trichonephila clavipes]
MRKAVWAVYFHIHSSDEEPLHSFCPVGPNSWCKYQNQVLEGSVENFRHSNKLPVAVMDAIKPVFNDLSQPKLLQKCLGVCDPLSRGVSYTTLKRNGKAWNCILLYPLSEKGQSRKKSRISLIPFLYGQNIIHTEFLPEGNDDDCCKFVPLSHDTVARRNEDIAEDVEQPPFGKLRDKLFSIQLDEATDAHFIAYVRFWDGMSAVEELFL